MSERGEIPIMREDGTYLGGLGWGPGEGIFGRGDELISEAESDP